MIKRAILLALVLLLSLPVPVLAAEPDTGTIEGILINGTDGGSSVADQTVNLKIYLNDAEQEPLTTTTDAGGKFFFTGLATGPGYSYESQLYYQTAEYTSPRTSFSENETIRTIEITVYDATTSNEELRISTAHSLVYLGQGSLQVNEYYQIINDSDLAYIGSREVAPDAKETLRFSLPAGASQLQPEFGLMDCCIYNTEDGLIDSMAVLPGAKEIAFSYIVDYSSGKYTLPYQTNLPVDRYDLLVEGDGVKVESDQLITGELVDMNGLLFNHLSRQELAAGEKLVVEISGLPETSSTGDTVLLVLLVLVVLSAGFGFLYMTKRTRNLPAAVPVAAADNPGQQRQKLLIEMAQLDDNFESGKITRDNYQKQRSARKAKLIELEQNNKR